FFDIDGTLISRNSAQLYMRHMRRSGQARRRDVARTFYLLALYKLGLLDMEQALAVSLEWVRGRAEEEIRADCVSWYARDVRRYLVPEVVEAIAAHRRNWTRDRHPHQRHALSRGAARGRRRRGASARPPPRRTRRPLHR